MNLISTQKLKAFQKCADLIFESSISNIIKNIAESLNDLVVKCSNNVARRNNDT